MYANLSRIREAPEPDSGYAAIPGVKFSMNAGGYSISSFPLHAVLLVRLRCKQSTGFHIHYSTMADDDRVDSEEEMEEDDDEDEGYGVNMMNFMFGNVDSHGELEGDFLDEVCASLTCPEAPGITEQKSTTALCLQEAKQSLGGLQSARAGLDMSVSSTCQL